MADPVPFVEVFRGPFLESSHLGHAVVADASGAIIESWGNPDLTILPRSSAKMIQALPLLESNAGKSLDDAQVALACASHSGGERHVELVADWLADLGLDEHALRCGPQSSRDRVLRHQMIRDGAPVSRMFNNCSGKHAGFLTLAKHLGAGPDYVDPAHPVQVAVKSAFEEATGEDSPGFGIDGCSAPNFATSLKGLAQAVAKYANAGKSDSVRDLAMARARDAMMAHPLLVSGPGCACAEISMASQGRAIIKTGAEGVYVAILPGQGLGVALKVLDGATRASEIAMAAILVRLGALDRGNTVVAGYCDRPILNWDGLRTGVMRPSSTLLPDAI